MEDARNVLLESLLTLVQVCVDLAQQTVNHVPMRINVISAQVMLSQQSKDVLLITLNVSQRERQAVRHVLLVIS